MSTSLPPPLCTPDARNNWTQQLHAQVSHMVTVLLPGPRSIGCGCLDQSSDLMPIEIRQSYSAQIMRRAVAVRACDDVQSTANANNIYRQVLRHRNDVNLPPCLLPSQMSPRLIVRKAMPITTNFLRSLGRSTGNGCSLVATMGVAIILAIKSPRSTHPNDTCLVHRVGRHLLPCFHCASAALRSRLV